MKKFIYLIVFLLFPLAAHAEDGLKVMASRYDFQTTQARLEQAIKAKDLTVFAVIDHAAGARKAGLALQPTTVTLFGSPKAGTPFMAAAPESAIDFPLRMLVWQGAQDKTYVAYRPVAVIAKRFHIAGKDALAAKIDGLQQSLAQAAAE